MKQRDEREEASGVALRPATIYDFLHPKLERVAQELHDRLIDFAEDGRFAADLDRAFHIFFSEEALEILDPEEEAAFISFIEWFIYDYRLAHGEKRLIDIFAQEEGHTLGDLEREVLSSWLETNITLLEVVRVSPEGVAVEDLFTGEKLWIADPAMAAGVTLWSILLCRVLPVGDSYQPSGAALEVPPMFKRDILRQAQLDFRRWQRLHGRAGGWRAYLRERGYSLNVTVAKLFAAGQEDFLAREEEMRRRNEGRSARVLLGLSPELRGKLLRQYYEEYFRQWPDTPHPNLRGYTPRQSCQSPAGRRRVREMLKELEFIEERKRQAGEVHYDIGRLRQALNLPAECGGERPSIKWTRPVYAQVAEELRWQLANAGYLQPQVENAVQLWADYCRVKRPEIKKRETWLAALEYTMARLEFTGGITQKDLSEKYNVAVASISSKFRSIWQALKLENFDQRYTTQEDPYTKLLRFLR
ncbi:MAG: DUF2384 domain-containing protein [Firmicutes bacterium]|nr:DUF2384 domain-containing protein [Bacillota bacterium]